VSPIKFTKVIKLIIGDNSQQLISITNDSNEVGSATKS